MVDELGGLVALQAEVLRGKVELNEEAFRGRGLQLVVLSSTKHAVRHGEFSDEPCKQLRGHELLQLVVEKH